MAGNPMSRLAQPLRLLISTAWVGITWGIGYVAAPTLFARLPDRALAGTIAGYLFRVEALVSVVAAVLLLALLWSARQMDASARRRCLQLAGVMLACTLVGYYGLQPFMAELRAAAGGIVTAEQSRQFGMLHGVSSLFYLLKSLAGAWLVLRLR